MKCHVHCERESVDFCQECHAPLCPECKSSLGSLCINCAEKICKEGRIKILGTIAIGIVIFSLMLVYQLDHAKSYNEPFEFGNLLTCILAMFIPYGWGTISKLFRVFIGSSFQSLLFYFLIKLVVSILIGWILGIPRIVEMIKLWKSYNEIEKAIKEMRIIPKSRVVSD